MRGKKLGRFLGALVAVALAVGATSQAAFAGGAGDTIAVAAARAD